MSSSRWVFVFLTMGTQAFSYANLVYAHNVCEQWIVRSPFKNKFSFIVLGAMVYCVIDWDLYSLATVLRISATHSLSIVPFCWSLSEDCCRMSRICSDEQGVCLVFGIEICCSTLSCLILSISSNATLYWYWSLYWLRCSIEHVILSGAYLVSVYYIFTRRWDLNDQIDARTIDARRTSIEQRVSDGTVCASGRQAFWYTHVGVDDK